MVNPAKRALIKDICCHWWVNLGYKKTPTEDTPLGRPVDYHCLERSLTVSSDSDSDLPDATQRSHHKKQKPLKGILKKPKDFSIGSLKGHHSDSGFYNGVSDWTTCQTDDLNSKACRGKISSQCETKLPTDPAPKSIQVQHSLSDEGETSQVRELDPLSSPTSNSDSVFDSNRKPKRGILKNKNKHRYQGADSGCVIEDINLSEYFESNNLKSLAASRPRSVSTTGSESSSKGPECDPYDDDDIESILVGLESLGTMDHCNHFTPVTYKNTSKNCSLDQEVAEASQLSPELKLDGDLSEKIVDSSSPDSDEPEPLNTSNPGKKLKGILKWHGKYSTGPDPTWRYSLGSQSSNSSGDILDFSYDSGEGEGVLTDPSRRPDWSPPPPPSISADEGCVGDVCEEDLRDIYTNLIDDFRPIPNHRNDNIMNKINMLDEAYFEEGIHREAVTSDLFRLGDAKEVYEEALQICRGLSEQVGVLCQY